MNYLYHYIITRLCIVSPWWSNEIPIYFYSALIDVDKVVIRESVSIIPGLYVNYKSSSCSNWSYYYIYRTCELPDL